MDGLGICAPRHAARAVISEHRARHPIVAERGNRPPDGIDQDAASQAVERIALHAVRIRKRLRHIAERVVALLGHLAKCIDPMGRTPGRIVEVKAAMTIRIRRRRPVPCRIVRVVLGPGSPYRVDLRGGRLRTQRSERRSALAGQLRNQPPLYVVAVVPRTIASRLARHAAFTVVRVARRGCAPHRARGALEQATHRIVAVRGALLFRRRGKPALFRAGGIEHIVLAFLEHPRRTSVRLRAGLRERPVAEHRVLDRCLVHERTEDELDAMLGGGHDARNVDRVASCGRGHDFHLADVPAIDADREHGAGQLRAVQLRFERKTHGLRRTRYVGVRPFRSSAPRHVAELVVLVDGSVPLTVDFRTQQPARIVARLLANVVAAFRRTKIAHRRRCAIDVRDRRRITNRRDAPTRHVVLVFRQVAFRVELAAQEAAGIVEIARAAIGCRRGRSGARCRIAIARADAVRILDGAQQPPGIVVPIFGQRAVAVHTACEPARAVVRAPFGLI
ncbi:hypothetical protein BamMEX5DRAFT_1544 [Burkholderia ambifaria MEX-5]|uniref:Uncharacterized protein n=1 Tax=Burkholderia ambifaria MEX-5 TaxID=396597 RepID=B1T178_9BURK|nr:hypothetical protein BamMEX5DRAFT_1544 [Burkholderia ambifaria MEX-5]